MKNPTVLKLWTLIWRIQIMRFSLRFRQKTVQEIINKAKLFRDCHQLTNNLYGLKLINATMDLRNIQCFQAQKIY
jgi:hypothetical protein